mgnify:CR=1 FL=1
MAALTLLDADGSVRSAPLSPAPAFSRPERPLEARVLFAAAHVVPKAHADNTPGRPAEIDWDATLAYRHHLYSWGLGVADAMDTAQRNMGLDAAATRELVTRSAADAAAAGARVVVGVNTDHVDDRVLTPTGIVDAYKEQLFHAEDAGAGAVLMASRHLARSAAGADDYRRVYGEVLAAAGAPVILHWLGPAFDPQLEGYFGAVDWETAAEVLLDVIAAHPDKVAGVKMSLLDADAEIAVRRRLPASARMFTGDDYHYCSLIEGDDRGHSDALLGAFAAIGPHASAAVQALDRGDADAYRAILAPTEALSQHVFGTPTYYYKTGIAFLAWLGGHQAAFQMVGGLHAARSLPHLSRTVELANACGALEDPELAASRWHALLRLNGIEAS